MKISKGLVAVIIASLTIVGLLLISMLAGYRYFNVVSPSMGETAPVGTLVITHPKKQYQVDDIVSFHRGSRIYTHRIVEINKDGNYVTKGDLNSVRDALFLKHDQIIGSSVFVGKYLGWLWQALPMLAIGFVVVYLISLWKNINEQWRWPFRILGIALTMIVVTVIVSPWVRADLLQHSTSKDGGADMQIVNTGVFPLRDGEGGRFFAGQVGIVHTDETDSQGRFVYFPRPSLGFWGVVMALLWCLMPLILAMTVKLPPPDEHIKVYEKKDKWRDLLIFTVALAASVVMLTMQLSTIAAFAVSVRNTDNTARTQVFMSCLPTMNRYSSPRPLFAYAMNSRAIRSGYFWNYTYTAEDVSGNNRTGYYSSSSAYSDSLSGSVGCENDTPRASVNFNGNNTCLANRTQYANPRTFSLEIRFRTNRKGELNGKLVGFGGSNNSPNDGSTDRHIYLDKDGRITFGVYTGAQVVAVSSPYGTDYADSNWHHVVATMSPDAGMKLYVDGGLVGQNGNTIAQNYSGYWKFGCGQMSGWRNADGTMLNGKGYYEGQLQYGAIYDVILTDDQVKYHYEAGL